MDLDRGDLGIPKENEVAEKKNNFDEIDQERVVKRSNSSFSRQRNLDARGSIISE